MAGNHSADVWRGLWLILGAAVVAGCASAPAVEVSLIGLAPVEATLLEQRLRLDFRLQNFGDRALSARGVDLELDVNGQRLARGVDNQPFHVEALGEATVSTVVSTSLFNVARQLLSLRDRQSFSYELSGKVHLDGWPRSARFRRTGEISRDGLARLVGGGGRAPEALTL